MISALPYMVRCALLALAIGIAAPAGLALAEGAAEEVAHAEEGHEEGHGGPISLKGILTDTHFMAAVLNFVLLLLVLKKLGGKGLSEFLTSRRATLEASINEAAEIKAKAEAKHQEYTARLATLDAELSKLKADLVRAAEDDHKRIQAEAEESARRLRVETESLVDQHALALSSSVRREIVEAAVLAAQQVIASSVNAADQEKLADGFRQRIEALAGHSRTPSGRPARAPIGGRS